MGNPQENNEDTSTGGGQSYSDRSNIPARESERKNEQKNDRKDFSGTRQENARKEREGIDENRQQGSGQSGGAGGALNENRKQNEEGRGKTRH